MPFADSRPAHSPQDKGHNGQQPIPMRLGWWWKAPRGILLVVVTVVLTSIAAFGATRPNTGNPPAPTSATPSPSRGLPTPVTAPNTASPPDLSDLATTIARIAGEHGVEVGVQLATLAAPDKQVEQSWRTGTVYSSPALGTIDLAMGMALVDDPKPPSSLDHLLNRSLADNSASASEAIWTYLGGGEDAAARTQTALRFYQNWGVSVATSSTTSPSTPFRDTNWPLSAQAEFMAHMGCDRIHAFPVLSKLNDPADNPWGLQGMPMARARADTGFLPNGSAVARQAGLVRTRDGVTLGVAIVAIDPTGDIDQTREALTRIAGRLRPDAVGFVAGGCSA